MPTYEYACTECGHHLEVAQSFTDEPLTTCPNCGAPLRKVFGSIGIVLKGSGFYKNDSRSSSTPKTATGGADSAPAASDGSPAATGGSGSDTKVPAAKETSTSGSSPGSGSGSAPGPGGSAAASS
ncbi:MAG TPA: FmdB family zinc ribbon protein [Acidimicrobiales bacterium]|nr:FmdB family zinc ribbon protein [Acidimicrobiales bacterium]